MKQLAILATLLILMGCKETGQDQAKGDLTINLTRSYSNAAPYDQEDGEKINTLRYFICEQGVIKIISENIAGGQGVIKIDQNLITPLCNIYVIANGELSAQIGDVTVGAQQSVFSTLETAQSDNNGQVRAIAMAAFVSHAELAAGAGATLRLRRNMARFDLDVAQDQGIEVLDVRVVGLATSSTLFPTATENSPNTASYVSDFESPVTESIRGLFYAHPRAWTDMGTVVEADVRFNGKLTTLTSSVSQIQRNCINTIAIKLSYTPPSNPTENPVTMEITTSPMLDGDSSQGQPGQKYSIELDPTQSTLPPQVSISDDGQQLILPYWGVQATIAIKAPLGTTLSHVDGAVDGLSVTPIAGQPLHYTISTLGNTRIGTEKKAVLLNFTFPDNTLNNKYRITVIIDNYSAFHILTLDGLDWMEYNAFSKNLTDYHVLPQGSDIRDAYRNASDWARFTGKACQWGPRQASTQYLVAAWQVQQYIQSDLININGQIVGGSKTQLWDGLDSPCPRGWRIPTIEEFRSIWPPDGTTIQSGTPVSYTSPSGNNLSAVIETFGGSYPTHSGDGPSSAQAQNLIIKSGAQELLFPIAGYRTPDGVFTDPDTGKSLYTGLGAGMGSHVYYWCSDRSGKNYVALGIANGISRNDLHDHTPNMWYYQRCVRTAM